MKPKMKAQKSTEAENEAITVTNRARGLATHAAGHVAMHLLLGDAIIDASVVGAKPQSCMVRPIELDGDFAKGDAEFRAWAERGMLCAASGLLAEFMYSPTLKNSSAEKLLEGALIFGFAYDGPTPDDPDDEEAIEAWGDEDGVINRDTALFANRLRLMRNACFGRDEDLNQAQAEVVKQGVILRAIQFFRHDITRKTVTAIANALVERGTLRGEELFEIAMEEGLLTDPTLRDFSNFHNAVSGEVKKTTTPRKN